MDIKIKEQIKIYIELLSTTLPTDNDFKIWIPNCIECLQFALDNEDLLNDKSELYQDTLSTLSLLYSWIIEDEEWIYIELRQKFRKIFSPKEVGKALKEFANRLTKINYNVNTTNFYELSIDIRDNNGNIKSFHKILKDLSKKWIEISE